jgi:hypothetical protein
MVGLLCRASAAIISQERPLKRMPDPDTRITFIFQDLVLLIEEKRAKAQNGHSCFSRRVFHILA